MKDLKVIGRYLASEDDAPFFYLADTAWELFHRLNQNETWHYLKTRSEQGFTVIQAVALAEKEGLTKANAYGRLPLKKRDGLPDPANPDLDDGYSYWDHVDHVLTCAQKLGLHLALLPTWGDKFNQLWGDGPEIFTPENALAYGRFLGKRYQGFPNLIWMLGGDRPLEPDHRRLIDAMAHGIRQEDPRHLMTFHPPGTRQSTEWLRDAPYIDFHTAQSGHGIEQCYASDAVLLDMARMTDKPYMDSEPRYEAHPACFDESLGHFWDAADIRQNAYWNVFAGACGHAYGHHSVWVMNDAPGPYFTHTWQASLQQEGARQIAHVKTLRLRRDYFSFRPAEGLVVEAPKGMGHVSAGQGKNYAYLYSPLGLPFSVDLTRMGKARCHKALWFDPRTGKETVFAILPPSGITHFAPPTQGKGCDWVLILEAKL